MICNKHKISNYVCLFLGQKFLFVFPDLVLARFTYFQHTPVICLSIRPSNYFQKQGIRLIHCVMYLKSRPWSTLLLFNASLISRVDTLLKALFFGLVTKGTVLNSFPLLHLLSSNKGCSIAACIGVRRR